MPRKAKRKQKKSAGPATSRGGSKTSAGARVAKHRASLRAKGMRLVQIWVPDTRSPTFKAEARRTSRLLAKRYNAPDSEERRILEDFQSIAAWPEK
jgi:hypothetical protein